MPEYQDSLWLLPACVLVSTELPSKWCCPWAPTEEAIEWAGTEQLQGYFGIPEVVLVAFPKPK